MNNEKLIKESYRKSNLFNVWCLLIVNALTVLAEILNEIGAFQADKFVMRLLMIIVFVLTSIPAALYLINDYILKKEESILDKSYFEIIIITIFFITMAVLCTLYSFHTALLLVVPFLVTAQYRTDKKIVIITSITSFIILLVSQYGSVLFGHYDANLLKPLTKEEALIFENRLNILNGKRIIEIFLHHILTKSLCLALVQFITYTYRTRNTEMLNKQIELNNKVNEEILAKSTMQNGVIEHLADIIESRDIETGEHIKRTKKYVAILVNKMKNMNEYKDYLTPKMCDYIIGAAPLHDIGKIAVSDLILCKPGKLTDEEFEKMKVHTVKGGEIIKNILNDLGDEEFLNVAYDIAISHHEKWNGKGYPYNKKEEEIPLSGRIMAIADVFDALVAKRVYKDPVPLDKAVEIIINDAGNHFDPNLVEVFKEVVNEFKVTAIEKL